jgi:hypothetical protein
MSEQASTAKRLMNMTIIVIIGILIIYIYHEYLKPSYDRALTKYERVHRVAEVYKRKKDNNESIPIYDVDELQQALIKVKGIIEEELKKKPDDVLLKTALSTLIEDLSMFEIPVVPQG